MKWAVVALRSATFISLLFFLGHSMGAPWTPEYAQTVREAFMGLHVPAVSPNRTYWDFYVGFGVSISIYLLTLTVVLWVSTRLVTVDRKLAIALLVPLAVGYVAIAIVADQYFFPLPAMLSACIGALVVLACVAIIRSRQHKPSIREIVGE